MKRDLYFLQLALAIIKRERLALFLNQHPPQLRRVVTPPKSIFDRKKKTGSKNKSHVETGITAPSKQIVQSSSSLSYSSKSFVSFGGLIWVSSRALFLVAHLVSSYGGAPINELSQMNPK